MEYPAKPEYLLSLRLVTSSITSRLGLDIEQIEDTKIAVSEACTMVMQHFTEDVLAGSVIGVLSVVIYCRFFQKKIEGTLGEKGLTDLWKK